MSDPLLSLEGLSISAHERGRRRTITHGIDLTVGRGETVAIVGESGSGKSMTARAIIGLLPPGLAASGRVVFKQTELLSLPESRMAQIRGSGIGMLLQDPFTMLNPLVRCGRHIEESLVTAEDLSRTERTESVMERLAEVGIDGFQVARSYPFQLSGGMRQRVALAAALARDPEVFIADEPTTALDVTTQAEILDLLRSIQRARGMALILITHDLRVAFSTAERVYVLYAGSLLEVARARIMEEEPLHPYTLALLLSEPSPEGRRELAPIGGSIPQPDDVSDRCAFEPRCSWAAEVCRQGRPRLAQVEPGRRSACVRLSEIREEMKRARKSWTPDGPSPSEAARTSSLIRVRDLSKTFPTGGRPVRALQGVSLSISSGESVGLVGESGSGKTTVGRCLVGLESPDSGIIEVDGIDATDLARLSVADRARVRRTIQIVFQDPYSSLNPKRSVGWTLSEALRMTHEPHQSIESGVRRLLGQVGLPAHYADRRPARLSGGERQRVAIARALAVRPRVLICDEPVSALDVSIQAQILMLLKQLREDLGIAYLFITHDLAVVRQITDRAYVLYRGEVVEDGPVDDLFSQPSHWYTQRLINSVPR